MAWHTRAREKAIRHGASESYTEYLIGEESRRSLCSHGWHHIADAGGNPRRGERSVRAAHRGNENSGSRLQQRAIARDGFHNRGASRDLNFLLAAFILKRQQLFFSFFHRHLLHFFHIGVGHRRTGREVPRSVPFPCAARAFWKNMDFERFKAAI